MAKQGGQYIGGGFSFGSELGKAIYGQQNLTSDIKVNDLTTAGGPSKKQVAEAKVASYLDSIPGSLEFDKIPPKYRQQATEYLQQARANYANAANTVANFEPGTPAYRDAMGQMADAQQAITTLGNQFKDLVERKKELPDFRNGLVSEGNDPNGIDFLTSALTDELDLAISPNGTIGFVGVDGNVTELNGLPEYFNKDFKSFDKVLKYGNSIYSNAAQSGQALDDYTRRTARLQLETDIRTGGRETLLSLAQDDFLIDGGLSIPSEILNDPSREDELRSMVIDGYMSMYEQAAADGVNQYNIAQQRQRNKGGGSGASAKGYAKNTQGDVSNAKAAWNKASVALDEAIAAVDAGDEEKANAILKEHEAGFNFDFYASEDEYLGRDNKGSYYVKPFIDIEAGKAMIMYKKGSKGEWQYISKEDFDKEMAGQATVGSKYTEEENADNSSPTIDTSGY